MLAVALSAHAAADDNPPPVPDVLVYNNGDRVQGRLVRREGDTLVFRTVRFGDLRVPVSEASIIAAGAPVLDVPPDGHAGGPGEKPPVVPSSPYKRTQFLQSVFGPWSGRFAMSSQVVSDSSNRTDFMTEASLNRTWTKDEVNLTARYDYNQTNDVNTTDIFRGSGSWRNMLPNRLFTVYRPSYEWNRASTINGVSNDYILLQQEVGLGVKAVDREEWKIRVGLAENFFNNWDLTTDTQHAAHVESLFLEADLKLPWRIAVTERAVYYYSIATGGDGWEHQFEVTKKLTDTVSLGLRHEVRYNDPDVRTADYSLLRLLLGFNF